MARLRAPDPEKEARLAALLQRRGADAILVADRANIAWLSEGADVHCDLFGVQGVARLLWSPGRRVVLTSVIEAARLAEEEFGEHWEIASGPWWSERELPRDRRILSDLDGDPLAEARAPFTVADEARLRDLARDAAQASEEALMATRPLERELDVAARWIGALRARDIQAPVCLVAADERAFLHRHPIPGARRFARNLLAGMCGTRHGLVVCLSRLLSVGEPDTELARRHRAVLEVEAALHASTRPGGTLGGALQAGVDAYARVGFPDEWRLHHQGGSMGYRTRDRVATPGDATPIVAGQSYGWNPSIAGAKAEDAILGGGEVLTRMAHWPTLAGRPDILRA
ncbi:MAG: hypothetical protein RL112_2873 [Planctomycetota bacterium]